MTLEVVEGTAITDGIMYGVNQDLGRRDTTQ